MSEASAAAAARIKQLQEENAKRRAQVAKPKEELRQNQQSATDAKRFEKIQENIFFKTLISSQKAPKEQLADAEALMIATKDKKSDQTRLTELTEFQDWALYQNKVLAQRVISLLDTTTEAELQSAYNDIVQGVNDYEDKVRPFVENLKSFYRLHVHGKTHDVVREIKDEEERKAQRAKERAEQEATLKNLAETIETKQKDNETLRQDRTFWGMGGIRKEALEKISSNDAAIEEAKKEIERVSIALEQSLSTDNPQSALEPELIQDKERLREFLNLSSEEHIRLKTDLLTTTNDYINDVETRVTAVLDKMNKGEKSTREALDATMKLRNIFAIMQEAVKGAKTKNSKIRSELQTETPEESEMDKVLREDELIAVENHVATLDMIGNSTISRLTELSAQSLSLKGRRDNKIQQIQKTRDVKTAGIATMANNVALTLDSLTNTSLSQAADVAESSINRMNKGSHEIIAENATHTSVVMQEENAKISTMVSELGKLSEEFSKATAQQKQTLSERHELEQEMMDQAAELKKTLQSSIAMRADAIDSAQEGVEASDKKRLEAAKPANDDRKAEPSIFNLMP